jgi:uncharacterized membrane protein YjdF
LLSDLILALPAALMVGLVPGWFWTRVLLASSDLPERLAYSVGLSMVLVPSVALVGARLVGTGVTLTVAVVSPIVVFFLGLAVYLRFGPAEGSGEPLAPPPASPGLPALVPLVAAFALASGILLGAVPARWAAFLVAPLVFAAGILHLLTSRRRNTPRASIRDPGSPVAPTLRYAALSVVLLLVLLRGYLGPLLHDWPYPRGVDRYEHAVMTGMTLSDGTTESFMLYPPGLHFLAAEICRLTGLEPLEALPVVAPLLLLLPALACYALARRLWGWEYGVAAALLSGVILVGPYLHFAEARYPNFIGTQFLLVLAVAVLIGLYAVPSVRGGILLALLGSSTVLYHQIASYSLAVLLAVVGSLFLPYLLLRDRKRGLALLSSLLLLGLLSVLYAWDTYDLGRLVAGLVGGSEATGRGGEAVAMAIGSKPAYDIGHLLATTSQSVAWLGLLGISLVVGELLLRRDRMGTPQRLAYLTLLLWAVLLFVGSRTTMSSFPDRFERDLGIPLSVLAALALVAVLRSLRLQGQLTFAVALLAVTLVGVQAALNLEHAAGPSPRLKDRPPPSEVVAAGEWLEEHNEGGNIVATPYLAYVPSRGMLAMGGYTGMQSYDAARIRRGRDLPPFGAGPLWDALWVLQHPEGERTSRILSQNDVRYVVFHKRYPTIDWRPYGERTNLYRKAFENESVVIFEPR